MNYDYYCHILLLCVFLSLCLLLYHALQLFHIIMVYQQILLLYNYYPHDIITIYNSSIFAQSCHCFRPFSTVQMKGLLMANLIRQRVDNAAMLSWPYLCVSPSVARTGRKMRGLATRAAVALGSTAKRLRHRRQWKSYDSNHHWNHAAPRTFF